MSDIIDKVIKAGDLPPQLRGDLDADETVLVSVRRLTENGFTEAFEAEVLEAEQDVEGVPFRPAKDVIEELTTLAKNNSGYSPRFASSFRKLASADKITVLHAIELFQENPRDVSLHNHDLVGRLSGKRAFAAGDDLRIVFTERGNYQDVTLLHVGSHSTVYRR